MSIPHSQSEVLNETQDEVNRRSINSKAASSLCSKPMPSRMRSDSCFVQPENFKEQKYF